MDNGTTQDQQLKCADCKLDFTWTAGEQAFFAERGFTPPKRCKPCRDAKKAEKADREAREGGGGGAAAAAPREDYGNAWRSNEGRDSDGGGGRRGGRRGGNRNHR